MSDEFEKCLKNRKIIKFPKARDKVKVELKAGKEDLKNATPVTIEREAIIA